jgi:hypothetical protein
MGEPNDLLTEVQDLTSALLDEQATDEQVRRLEELLLASDEARRTYVAWIQLHADLHYMLGKKETQLPTMVETKPAKTKGKAAKKPAPLPQVDLPSSTTDSHYSNGFRS